jgi:hypothetical protein
MHRKRWVALSTFCMSCAKYAYKHVVIPSSRMGRSFTFKTKILPPFSSSNKKGYENFTRTHSARCFLLFRSWIKGWVQGMSMRCYQSKL